MRFAPQTAVLKETIDARVTFTLAKRLPVALLSSQVVIRHGGHWPTAAS